MGNPHKLMCKCFTPSACYGGGFTTTCRSKEHISPEDREDENLFFWAKRVATKQDEDDAD